MANQNQNQNQNQTQAIVSSYASAQSNSPQAGASTQTSTQNTGQLQASAQASGSNQSRAVIGVFDSRHDAENAVSQLRKQGFSNEEINIVSKEDSRKVERGTDDDDVSDGALTGGTIGGIGGLLLGAGVVSSVGALAIPGIGPIIASGPIAAAIGGAVAGGIAGGLIDWGIPAEASRRYEESVARGGILAVIRTSSAKVDAAAQVFRQNGASDIESHGTK